MNNHNQISDVAIVSEATHDDDDDLSSDDSNFPSYYTGRILCDNHSTENNSDCSGHTMETNNFDNDAEENPSFPPFFCNKMDEDDEAWVMKNIRGGNDINHDDIFAGDETSIHADKIRKLGHSKQVRQENKGKLQNENKKYLYNAGQKIPVITKPRHSDAILSCPYCFNIVCMDCQKHERFSNQYRAMFVMNIAVRWDNPHSYDSHSQQLRPLNFSPSDLSPFAQNSITNANVSDHKPSNIQFETIPEEEKKYYFVQCDNCSTEVAVLDNDEEIYHFIGCVASS